MDELDKTLTIITNETKQSIDSMNIVTPSVYASLFAQFANEHNINLDDEENLAKELLHNECSQMHKIQMQTGKNADALSKNTNKAIDAIHKKDESMLQEVLHETQLLKQEINKLRESVYRDELTHAFNRKWFLDHYTDEEGEKFITSGILVLIDLNYFKQINDTYGHVIGDKVLIFIVAQLKKTKQPVIRYGGDEFLLVFPKEFTLKSVEEKLTQLREQILKKKLKAKEATFTVSFSIGLEAFREGEELSSVLESADAQMYEDKAYIKQRIQGI